MIEEDEEEEGYDCRRKGKFNQASQQVSNENKKVFLLSMIIYYYHFFLFFFGFFLVIIIIIIRVESRQTYSSTFRDRHLTTSKTNDDEKK